jgi:hypothetical protein
MNTSSQLLNHSSCFDLDNLYGVGGGKKTRKDYFMRKNKKLIKFNLINIKKCPKHAPHISLNHTFVGFSQAMG